MMRLYQHTILAVEADGGFNMAVRQDLEQEQTRIQTRGMLLAQHVQGDKDQTAGLHGCLQFPDVT